MTFKTIITGATGMVGEGVLLECLNHPAVEQILVINRKPGGMSHPKLREIIHSDFFDLTSIESQLSGYDACFFCLGVSSVGLSRQEYEHITYDLTLNVAQRLAKRNPDMTFCYITGAGTDSGLYETHTRTDQGKELLLLVGLDISDRSRTVPRRLLYVAGSGTGDDQRGPQRVPSTYFGSERHCTVGESFRHGTINAWSTHKNSRSAARKASS